MTTVICETCSGTGTVIETWSRWIGGTIEGYESRVTLEVRCDDCDSAGNVLAIACIICDAVVPEVEAIRTVDGDGHICEACYELEQAAILAGAPEVAYLVSWSPTMPGPEVA